mgnify:CR=1 FL=1
MKLFVAYDISSLTLKTDCGCRFSIKKQITNIFMCQVSSEPHILIFSIMIIYEIATYPFVVSGSRIILKC